MAAPVSRGGYALQPAQASSPSLPPPPAEANTQEVRGQLKDRGTLQLLANDTHAFKGHFQILDSGE